MNQAVNSAVCCQTKARCISVIIPTYNRAALLTGAIESVLAQRDLPQGVELEVIVVDDGSGDDTRERVAAFAPHVTYIRQANGGVARARNAGILRSRGELVCFLDSDDLWLPEKLSRQLSMMDAHPEAGLIATEITPFDGKGADRTRSKAALYAIHDGWVVEKLLFGNWIQTSTVMARRTALLAAGGFDEDVGQFGEDWLLWMRIASACQVRFAAEPLVCYRLHAGSLMSYQPESQFASLMCILDKLERLPQFVRRPELVARARYRVCVLRGARDLQAGSLDRAVEKLRRAMRLQRFPLRALVLLCRATALLAMRRDPAARAGA